MNPTLPVGLVILFLLGGSSNLITLNEEDTAIQTRLFQIQGSAMWCINAYRQEASVLPDAGSNVTVGDVWLHDNPDFDGKCIELLPESVNVYHVPKGNPSKLVTMGQWVPTSLNVNGTVHEFVGSGDE